MVAENPSDSHGQHNGPASPRAPASDGTPDAMPLSYCRKCQTEVLPEGKGKCPRCGVFLRQNFVARRHPVNVLRRQQLLDKFVLDYRPDTQRLQSMCEQYAGVVEQLEVTRPGSPEHQRLVQLSQSLGTALEGSCRDREQHTRASLQHLSLPELVSRTERLAEDARALAQHELDDLQAAVRGPVPPAPAPAPAAEPGAVGAVDDAPAAPPCSYCGDRPCCGKDHAAYSTLHYNDPEEVERRRVENTAVMYRTVGKTSPYL